MSSFGQKLAEFVVETKFGDLPDAVVHEAKRTLLDSIGCALAGIECDKGRISVALSRRLGGTPESSIIGTSDKVSCCSAGFANGELINALDMDALIMRPGGHIPPTVIPASLAIAESTGASGEDLILSSVLGHEISARIARALSNLSERPVVYGEGYFVFGATAGASKLLKLDVIKMSHAFGIAGYICPVHHLVKWQNTVPAAMAKYGPAGWTSSAGIHAAMLAEMGYVGDTTVFDGEYGFWKFCGSEKWEPEAAMQNLGKTWFMLQMAYKLYPCNRPKQSTLDCFTSIIEKNNIMPDEIQSVEIFGPAQNVSPVCKNIEISTHVDAQFSTAYAIAVAAHRVRPGSDWQDLNTIKNTQILKFMEKVHCEVLSPEIDRKLPQDPRRSHAIVKIVARERAFKEERIYARGTPFTDFQLTDEELVEKFKHNASRILTEAKINDAIKLLMQLEMVDNVTELVKRITL